MNFIIFMLKELFYSVCRLNHPNDDDDDHHSKFDKSESNECKSEGNIFNVESSSINMNSHISKFSNVIRRYSSQCQADEFSSERRWHWSKESGGLIDKGNRKKKQQSNIKVKSKEKFNHIEGQLIYESLPTEQIQALKKTQSSNNVMTNENNIEQNNNKQISKQVLHAIMNTMTRNREESSMNEFFENGPYTNPEETIANITSSA